MFTLLEFQEEAVRSIAAKFAQGTRAVLLQSATASGKTVIAGDFVHKYLHENNDHKVLVLLNLQVLVGQTYDTMSAFGIKCSVLHDEITRNAAGDRLPLDWRRRVQITMPETFINARSGRSKSLSPKFDHDWNPTLILIDEAHKGTSLMYQMIRDMFPKAIILGLTATPFREQNDEGEHLTEWYGNNLISTISVRDLIACGRLVEPMYFSRDEDDHLVETWLDITGDSKNKSTIVFTRNTEHSLKVKEAFLERNIRAEIITAGSEAGEERVAPQTPQQRQAIYNDFDNGRIQVLVSVSALCEGFDSQRAKYCFLARSVGNIALYHQMIGRVLRAWEGHAALGVPRKLQGVVVDFFGNIGRHGYIEDYQWSLASEADEGVVTLKRGQKLTIETLEAKRSILHICEHCTHIYDIKRCSACKHCSTSHGIEAVGKVNEVMSRKLGVTDGKNYEMLIARLKGAMNATGETGQQLRAARNREYALSQRLQGLEHTGRVFEDDGSLTSEFQFMAPIISGKLKWTAEFRVQV